METLGEVCEKTDCLNGGDDYFRDSVPSRRAPAKAPSQLRQAAKMAMTRKASTHDLRMACFTSNEEAGLKPTGTFRRLSH